MGKYIDAIKKALADLDQPSVFGIDYEPLEQACTAFLKQRKYKVVKSPKITNLTKIDDLIEAYYALEQYWHPDRPGSRRDAVRDRALAKRFVEARMEASGLDKESALNECFLIIRTVFRHEDDFNFTLPFSFGMFGQKKCGWITEKALQILEDPERQADYNDKYAEKIADQIFEQYADEITGIIEEKEEGVF